MAREELSRKIIVCTPKIVKLYRTYRRVGEVAELPSSLVVHGSILVAGLLLIHVTMIFPRFETCLQCSCSDKENHLCDNFEAECL